jgi:hypothetical protein
MLVAAVFQNKARHAAWVAAVKHLRQTPQLAL